MSRLLVISLIAACGGSTGPAVTPSLYPAPATSTQTSSEESPAEVTPDVAPIGVSGAISTACRGPALDLTTIAASHACDSRHVPSTLPDSVTRAIDPTSVALQAGKQAAAAVVLTNTESAEIELYLDDACDQLTDIASELRDTEGNRVDLDGDACGTGRGCGGKSIAVVLEPGGTARIAFSVDGRKQRFDRDCKSSRAGGVRPGNYDLAVFTTVGELHAVAVVR